MGVGDKVAPTAVGVSVAVGSPVGVGVAVQAGDRVLPVAVAFGTTTMTTPGAAVGVLCHAVVNMPAIASSAQVKAASPRHSAAMVANRAPRCPATLRKRQ